MSCIVSVSKFIVIVSVLLATELKFVPPAIVRVLPSAISCEEPLSPATVKFDILPAPVPARNDERVIFLNAEALSS